MGRRRAYVHNPTVPDLVQACTSRADNVVGGFEKVDGMRRFDSKNALFPPSQPDHNFIRFFVYKEILSRISVQIDCSE